jgi:hypothetical protein
MKNANQPINPMPHQNQDGTIQHDVYFGLTKREYFAALAMQGLLSNGHCLPNKDGIEYVVSISIKAADELLKQLENQNP